MDPKTGIHFNAKTNHPDRKQAEKLAAFLKGTTKMPEKDMTSLYYEYLKALENRSAQFIWNWWKTGKASFGSESADVGV
jgi:hypothetical protein